VKPTQLSGLPTFHVEHLSDGPTAPPDRRKWRQPSSLITWPTSESPVNALRRDDLVALRWHDGWKIAEHWRPEKEGILCVLPEGGSIWVSSAKGIMILHAEDREP
jgi:hypothetical protein